LETLDPSKMIALPTDCYKRYRGIAFDGCAYYLTMPQECKIYKFNRDFAPIECVDVCKPFSGICYDHTEGCFWTSVEELSVVIYKLDQDLKEIDRLQIKGCGKVCSSIAGLSYHCENNTLLVAFTDFVAEVPKDGSCICILQDACAGRYIGALSMAPYYAVIRQCGQVQEVVIFSADGRSVKSFCIPAVYAVEDGLFNPCAEKEKSSLKLIFLATKHCYYPRLLCYEIDACGMELCCGDCGGAERKGQCVCDLIESIALVETALSHILNAEGEKLQKAVELSEDVCQLLEVNRAVNKTIMNVTQLEQILYAKLDTLGEIHTKACRDTERGNQCEGDQKHSYVPEYPGDQ